MLGKVPTEIRGITSLVTLPATAITSEIITSKRLEISGLISLMISIERTKCTRPGLLNAKVSIAFSFYLFSFLIHNRWLHESIHVTLSYYWMTRTNFHKEKIMKIISKTSFFYFFTINCSRSTWTPKKGNVAEPGFCGHAPGIGKICINRMIATSICINLVKQLIWVTFWVCSFGVKGWSELNVNLQLSLNL